MNNYFILSVIFVAIGVLLLSMTFVGVRIYYSSPSMSFPPIKNICPDYWEIDQNGKCIARPYKNTGKLEFNKNNQIDVELHKDIKPVITNKNNSQSVMDPSDIAWSNLEIDSIKYASALCKKARWAQNNNIMWDGVTNNNQCS